MSIVIYLFAASVSSFSFSSRPWGVFDPGNGLRPAALFSGEEESKRMRATGSIVLCLLISFYLFFFFQEKEKQKEKKKRRYSLLLLLFSVFFSFLKKAKRQGKGQVWRSRNCFFRHFCFVFCFKKGKRRAKRGKLSFGSFLFFLEIKREKGEKPVRRRADAPPLYEVKSYVRKKLKR